MVSFSFVSILVNEPHVSLKWSYWCPVTITIWPVSRPRQTLYGLHSTIDRCREDIYTVVCWGCHLGWWRSCRWRGRLHNTGPVLQTYTQTHTHKIYFYVYNFLLVLLTCCGSVPGYWEAVDYMQVVFQAELMLCFIYFRSRKSGLWMASHRDDCIPVQVGDPVAIPRLARVTIITYC